MAIQKLKKCPQSRKPQPDGGPAQFISPQKAQKAAKIVTLQAFPAYAGRTIFLIPVSEFRQRLPIVSLGVNGSATIRCQMGEKLFAPTVAHCRAFNGGFQFQLASLPVSRNFPEVSGGNFWTVIALIFFRSWSRFSIRSVTDAISAASGDW